MPKAAALLWFSVTHSSTVSKRGDPGFATASASRLYGGEGGGRFSKFKNQIQWFGFSSLRYEEKILACPSFASAWLIAETANARLRSSSLPGTSTKGSRWIIIVNTP